MKFPNATIVLTKWKKVTVEKQNDQDKDEYTDNVSKKNYVTKLQCWSKQVYLGEVVELFEASFQEVLVHFNTIRIQPKNLKLTRTKRM